MTISQKSQTTAKFDQLVAKLQTKYQVTNKPTLEFKKIGKSAGYFIPRDNVIVLNPDFYTNHADDMINNTLPHELAHAYAHYHFRIKLGMRIKVHGPSWASVMNFLGLPAERCHTYDTDGIGRNTRPYSGFCCHTLKITKRMFNKIQATGKRCPYYCRKCNKRLNMISWSLDKLEPRIEAPLTNTPLIDISTLDISSIW